MSSVSQFTPTSLFFADTVEEVQAHFAKGYNINQVGFDYHTPLTRACCNGDLNRVKLLVENGADPTIQSGPVTRIHAASSPIAIAAHRGYFNIVKYLALEGVPLGGAMIAAINIGSKKIVDFLLDSNLIIDLEQVIDYYSNSSPGLTFLMAACEAKQFEIVAKLLVCGANPNTVVQNDSAMFRTIYCTTEKQKDVAFYIYHMLKAYGFSIESSELCDRLFRIAVSRGSVEIVADMIDQGLDVNSPDSLGKTPLIIAIQYEIFNSQAKNIISRLIQAGANPYIRDKQGCDAFSYVKVNEIRNLLLSYELMHRL